jgi:heme/copper-type cytochrome/quinol oxidase subunit 2
MADLNVRPPAHPVEEEEYDNWEIVLWLVGIISIPLVPILMVVFLTPWSGV